MARTFIEFAVTTEDHTPELLQETGQLGGDVSLVVTDTDQTIEQEMAKVDETFDGVVVGDAAAAEQAKVMELESLNGGIQETFDAVTQFEDLLNIARRAENGEGLSTDSAQLVEMTHENLVRSLRLMKGSSVKNPVLSLEHYRSDHSRKGASRVTVVTIESNFREILSKLKEAIIRAWNAIHQGLTNLIKNTEAVNIQLRSLEMQLNQLNRQDTRPKHSELQKPANGIRVGNKADVSTCLQILNTSGKLIDGGFQLVEALRNINLDERWFDQASSIVERVVHGLGPGAGDGTYGHLGAGRSVSFQRNSDSTISIGTVETGNPIEDARAPDIEEMKRLVKATDDVVSKLKAYERTLPAFRKASDTIIKTVDSIIGESNEETSVKEEKRKAIRAAVDMVTYFGSNVPGRTYAAIKYITTYITAGVNNYRQRDVAAPREA